MKVLLNNNLAETLGDAGAIAFNSTKHYMNEHKQVETPDFVEDFMFNYNFKEYNPETKTVPNTMGASFQQDLVLRGTPVVGNDHITITSGDAYSQVSFASTSANPFNRNSTKGKELTFIYKVGGDSKDKATLFCNRGRDATGGTGDYNWMIYINSGTTFLHKAQSGIAQLTVTTKPAIYCITNDASNKTTNKCLTTQALATGTSEYGSDSARITFFCSDFRTQSPIFLDERWSGECYWMFCANRVLTQEEIQRVINYNENIL